MTTKPPITPQSVPDSGAPEQLGCEPGLEFEQFYRTAPVGFATLNRDLQYVHVNEQLAAINGRPIEEHIGRSLHEVRPDIATQMESPCRKVIEAGKAVLNVELCGPADSHSGRQAWYLVSCHPIRSADNALLGVNVVVQDATERRAADKAAQDRIEFETLLANLSATFVNLPTEEINGRIEQWLQQLVTFLRVERSSIGLLSGDVETMTVTHSYAVEGIEPFRATVLRQDLPWCSAKLLRGESIVLNHLPEDLPAEAARDREYLLAAGFKSHVSVPLNVGGRLLGMLSFGSFHRFCSWPDEVIQRLHLVGQVFANAILRQKTEVELAQLRARLELENLYLREEVKIQQSHESIVGQSAAIRSILSQVEQVAPTDSTVLLLGETGTGKELLANAIHSLSARTKRAMIRINCAALSPTLIESELFGREKGAYTGALSRQVGRFEIADGSTLFLDEIGELPPELQVKLLRVLQDGQFERLGSTKTIRVDVRLVAATNRDLPKAVREGQFRKDLYYRLNVFPITVPPLREHIEDIPQLVWAFVDELARRTGRSVDAISKEDMVALQQYAWPGNVRELRNLVERAMIASKGPTLRIELPLASVSTGSEDLSLEQIERAHILRVLEMTQGRIRGQRGAAEILGMKPTTLDAKMAKLGIRLSRVGYHMS